MDQKAKFQQCKKRNEQQLLNIKNLGNYIIKCNKSTEH